GRIAQHFECNACHNDFPAKDVQIDHILPVIGRDGFTTWDSFINSLYCPKENLQVLCTECHSIKTKQENKERKNNVK
ncbi:HNH endonuclease signature motif containing protein, partial [Listeria monocytogenes]